MTKKNLFDQFINAAVRQVGRDGGKVISNIVYGDKHSIPLRNASKGNDSNIVLPEPQKRNFTKSFLRPEVDTLARLMWIMPLFGFLIYLTHYLSISIKRGSYLIDWEEENYVPDKRKKEGYRLNGWVSCNKIIESELEFEDLEITKSIKNKVLLWTLLAFLMNCYIAYKFWIA